MATTSLAMRPSPKDRQQLSIRGTIHLLSSLLTECCGIPRSPLECFRQGKFNKEEAILNLWRLTFHTAQIIKFLGDLKGDHQVQFMEPSMFIFITEKNLPAMQTILRQYLFELGYKQERFFDTSQCGSREVLLAFGWLLNKSRFFSLLTRHLLAFANRTAIPLNILHKHHLEEILNESTQLKSDAQGLTSLVKLKGAKGLSPDACIKALHNLVWLRGCVDHRWKSMVNAHSAYLKSAYKIHRSVNNLTGTRSPSMMRNMSLHEVFLLRFPNQFKAHVYELSRCVSMLQKLVQWQECEPLFWQWMESVLNLHEEEKEQNHRCTISTGDNREALLVKWKNLQEEMESLLQENKKHMDRLDRLLEHKTRTLEHNEVNRHERHTKKQLLFECPLVSLSVKSTSPVVTSMLEELTAIDDPAFVSVGASVVHSFKAFPTSAQLHPPADAKILGCAHALTKSAVDEIRELDIVVGNSKSRIKESLLSLEQRLPAALCKLEQHRL